MKMEGGSSIQRNEDLSSSEENEEKKTCDIGCCDPRRTLHRFIALIFMCLLGFGSYFCYDSPGALQDKFKDLNVTTTKFVLLYSIYSWPNVIFCFIGGFLIDSVFGIRLGTNLYMGLTLIGQTVFAAGGLYDIFWLMVLGRFIFGIGAESVAVAQNNYAVLWFKGKELNMVFGLQLSFARVGSTVNFIVMGYIYNWASNMGYTGAKCLGIALVIATLTCVLSFICSLILSAMDKRAERILRRNENASEEVVRLKDIKDFPLTFWLVTVVCVAYYVAIFPFIALGKVFFMEKFNMDANSANHVNSMVYLVSAFASPVFGLIIDKMGRNLFWVFVSTMVTLGAHMLLTFTMINPFITMIIMGISYSVLASALWPLVALVIPEYQLGTAYGICQAVQNLGLAVVSITAGMIVDNAGYYWLEMFFVACLYVSLIATVVLIIIDMCTFGILNMTPSQRDEYQKSTMTSASVEREELLSTVSTISPTDLLHSSSDFHIRNRYLSRIGAPLPSNYNIHVKGLAYRALR